MDGPGPHVIWSANAQPSLAERCGLTVVEYTETDEPEDLDADGGESVVRRFPAVALALGDSLEEGTGALLITNRYPYRSMSAEGQLMGAMFLFWLDPCKLAGPVLETSQ